MSAAAKRNGFQTGSKRQRRDLGLGSYARIGWTVPITAGMALAAGALIVGRNRLWRKGCAQSQREPGCAGAAAVQVRIDCPLEEVLGVRGEVSHPDAEVYSLNIVIAGLPELHVTETVASNEASRYISRTWSQNDFEIVVRCVTR